MENKSKRAAEREKGGFEWEMLQRGNDRAVSDRREKDQTEPEKTIGMGQSEGKERRKMKKASLKRGEGAGGFKERDPGEGQEGLDGT